MRLSGHIDQVLKGVCFVGVKRSETFSPQGTAFFVCTEHGSRKSFHLVTARHVIENLDSSIEFIHLRVNLKEGGIGWLKSPRQDWVFHPSTEKNKYVDVAVLPFYKPNEVKLLLLHLDEQALTPERMREDNIGIGCETFAIGLFTNHFGQDRNFPVARFGHLAMLAQEPMSTEYGFMDGHLVEAHSLGGSSGSPVFVTPELWQVRDGMPKLAATREWYFLGAISGHWTQRNPEDAIADTVQNTATGEINTGMMIVTPATRIREAIDHSWRIDDEKRTHQQ